VPQDISRVFLNIVNNACYAAHEKKAAGADCAPTVWVTSKDLGDAVEIRVRDNGNGIPPHHLEKLFTPFFTTKPAGKGTGLGLSVSHDIVVQHKGSLRVETQEGVFAEFIITLPKRPAAVSAAN
jgi:signal transduction histidine kinase